MNGPGGYSIWCAKPEHPPLVHLLEDTRLIDRASHLGATVQVEIVGDQLFLLHRGGFWPLASPGFWDEIDAIAGALAPFLARAGTEQLVQLRPHGAEEDDTA